MERFKGMGKKFWLLIGAGVLVGGGYGALKIVDHFRGEEPVGGQEPLSPSNREFFQPAQTNKLHDCIIILNGQPVIVPQGDEAPTANVACSGRADNGTNYWGVKLGDDLVVFPQE